MNFQSRFSRFSVMMLATALIVTAAPLAHAGGGSAGDIVLNGRSNTQVGSPCATEGVIGYDATSAIHQPCYCGSNKVWTAINSAPSCRIVTAVGTVGNPYGNGDYQNYVSDARCASDEYVMAGGGYANQWGANSFCPPGTPANIVADKGFLHTSIPDSDLKGWSVDAFAYNESGEDCTQAWAICCTTGALPPPVSPPPVSPPPPCDTCSPPPPPTAP
jgi:hypothetical protein